MTNEEAFYVSESDGVFVPSRATVGPWDPSLQHGGPGAALLGRALESLGERGDVRVAHFSLDFLGPLALRPMTVRAEIARSGKRIELATATAEIDGRAAPRGELGHQKKRVEVSVFDLGHEKRGTPPASANSLDYCALA